MGIPGSTVCVRQKLLCVCKNVTSASAPLSAFALDPFLLVRASTSSTVGVHVLIPNLFFFFPFGDLRCFEAGPFIATLDSFHLR